MNRSRNTIIILVIIIILLTLALIGALAYIFIDQNNEGSKNPSNSINQNIQNTIDEEEILEDEENEENEENLAVQAFNELFINYEGTEIPSATVKALISQIEINNTSSEHLIILDANGITTMEQIEDDKTYNVEFSYDDEGYIYEVKIVDSSLASEENEDPENENPENEEPTIPGIGDENTTDMDKLIFNTAFTSYLGNITGERLTMMLQTMAEYASKYPEHIITLSSNNLSDLNGIVGTDIYTVTLSYGDDGYINNINIDKKIN